MICLLFNNLLSLVGFSQQFTSDVHCVVTARAQKVAEWKDRKEAILRGEVSATEETTDTGIDSIYDVQEEVRGILHISYNRLLCD